MQIPVRVGSNASHMNVGCLRLQEGRTEVRISMALYCVVELIILDAVETRYTCTTWIGGPHPLVCCFSTPVLRATVQLFFWRQQNNSQSAVPLVFVLRLCDPILTVAVSGLPSLTHMSHPVVDAGHNRFYDKKPRLVWW